MPAKPEEPSKNYATMGHRNYVAGYLIALIPLVMSRLLRRTVKRIATRENLWGTGNRETIANSFFSRDSIIQEAIGPS